MQKRNARSLDFCICIVVFHFCSQNHGQESLCLALSGHTADGLPETAGPLRENTTKIFSIRITSLMNSWQTERTGAGITGKVMIYRQTSQLQPTLKPDTKGKQKTRKYLMTLCFSMTTNIIYDPLCNDMSIIHWKAVSKDIVNKHFWFANRKPEILLWKLRGWGWILETHVICFFLPSLPNSCCSHIVIS